MLTLYFDYPSPRAVLALLDLESALASARAAGERPTVTFVGIDPLGLDMTLPMTPDQHAELQRCRERLVAAGLDPVGPGRRPPTVRAHLVGGLAEAVGKGPAWRSACVSAHWREAVDLGERDVLLGLGERVGLPSEVVAGVLDDPGAVLAARRATAALGRRGVGGVPVLELDGTFVPADLDREGLQDLLRLA
ncbi:MAG: hypothetical protein RLZZ272_529 [Actinomycetota bacterium]